MTDILNISEIKSLFISEWVLIEDPKTDTELEIKSGKVIYHSKDRDEVYRQAVLQRPKYFALFFTGDFPADTAVVL